MYSHRMPPRCHEMNTAYMFHFIRPPSMDCDGPELFRALYGPDAENEPSPGAVVCVSDPSTGQVSACFLSMCEITSIFYILL